MFCGDKFLAMNMEGETLMDYRSIEKKADKLTSIYSELPIPVYEIAQEEGLEVYDADFGDFANTCSGFCDFEEKGIYLNQDDGPIRQFFVAAHELGHWFLHREKYEKEPDGFAFCLKQGVDANGFDIDVNAEKEAHYFAVNLVMPNRLIKVLRHRYSASDLASIFNVSRTMMEKRLNGVL